MHVHEDGGNRSSVTERSAAPSDGHAVDERLRRTLERSIDDGQRRLERSWPSLAATGLVGGLDVGAGVLALLVVRYQTGSVLLGALAFGIGFIALTLSKSELFTENFLVPVTTVVARNGSVPALLRLWSVTAIMNLVGGWVVMALVISGFPELEETARSV